MNSKFNMLFETNFTRFQGGGFLTGDIIKLKQGWESDEWSKTAPERLMDTLKQLSDSDLVMRVSTVKAIRPAVNSSIDQANQVDDFHVDITQEIAPGRFSGVFVTVPQNLIELDGDNDTLPEIPDSLRKHYDIDVKPAEYEKKPGDSPEAGEFEQFIDPAKQTGTEDKVNKKLTDKNISIVKIDPATSYTAGYM